MDFFENRYYTVNRLTLSVLGLWPYQHSRGRWIHVICILILFAVIMFMLVLKTVKMEASINFISYSLQFMIPCAAIILNLCYCYLTSNKMKMLLDHIKCDWSLLRPFDIKIIEKYSETGRSYTLVLLTVSTVFLFFHQAGGSKIKKAISDNTSEWTESAEVQLPIPILVPFIDQNRYFHCIVVFCFISALLGVLVLVGIMTLYLCSIQHACGMFSIVGCRMETMFDQFGDNALFCLNVICIDIFESIMLHARTIQFASILNSLFGPLYFIIIALHVVLLSDDIFQLFQAYAISHNASSMITCSLHISSMVGVTFIFSYTGQMLLDHSSDIFNKAYSSQWYNTPIKMQKILLFIMTRSIEESALAITKSTALSFEMFGKILQMSLSYFMALNSLQQ